MSTLRVLLVEQDPSISLTMSAGLHEQGFAVTWASDYESAVSALQPSTFDVLICAHRLGAHNGLHLVLRAVSERPSTVAVVTSPAPDPALAREASAVGALHVVSPWKDLGALAMILRSGDALLA